MRTFGPGLGSILLLLPVIALGQRPVEARVLDDRTSEPLPYASVVLAVDGKGVITNEEGVFRITAVAEEDTLVFSYLGYRSVRMAARQVRTLREVSLQPLTTELAAVQVVGRNDALYDLVIAAGKHLRKAGRYEGKTYYQLETRTLDLPVEGVECFYNGRFNGADIEALDLKQGRIGLLPVQGRYMVNLNTSRAFMLLHPAERNGAFPATPMQYRSRRALRRDFDITLLSATQGQEGSYHVQFVPKDSGGAFFRGELWVDPATATVRSLELACANCARHPFMPMGSEDELRDVALQYRGRFSTWEGRQVINTMELDYAYTYHTGPGSARLAERDPGFRNDWRFRTKGMLHLYAPGEKFILPFFRYDAVQTDYRKVLSMPYDSTFWADAPGLVRTDRQQRDEALFAREGLLLGSREMDPTGRSRKGFFESNYAFWSADKRIRLKNMVDSAAAAPTPATAEGATALASQLNLVVQLYLNVDRTQEGYRTFSATVFDGFGSWCHLPDKHRPDVLLNIFFDLCELERRRMQAALDVPGLTLERIRAIHAEAEKAMERSTGRMLKETRYGTDPQQLAKWNHQVYLALGVDNLHLFGVQPLPE
ncbi:MAG: carboxypeptidase-like regulatory domain-containing protein [Flavobacteriales bacterium]|nr:carboxypeptidase-like regulatory domain-containing protein [Flavobacteriales bacterium]